MIIGLNVFLDKIWFQVVSSLRSLWYRARCEPKKECFARRISVPQQKYIITLDEDRVHKPKRKRYLIIPIARAFYVRIANSGSRLFHLPHQN